MPEPRQGETKDGFIDRCISQVVDEEGKDFEEAVGKCFGIWETNKE